MPSSHIHCICSHAQYCFISSSTPPVLQSDVKHQHLANCTCAASFRPGPRAHLALALLPALGEKPIRLRGLFPKLSTSLAGYLLPPLKNLRQGLEESEPIVGLSLCTSPPPRPLGVMMPEDDGGEGGPPASMSAAELRGLVAMGLRLGLMGGSSPAMMPCCTLNVLQTACCWLLLRHACR